MPPLIHDEESDTEMPRKAKKGSKPHAESKIEADVHAKDQLKDELMEDLEANEGSEVAEAEKSRISPTASNADDEDEDAGSEEEDEEAFEVEAIVGHTFKGQGKGKPQLLLYNVKWKGYPTEDNTFEPEENLVSSRDLLAQYHHSIGGAPQPEAAHSAKKGKRSKSNAHDSVASATDASPVPPSKRRKQTSTPDGEASDIDETSFGSWVPKGQNWDTEIKTIETVERDQASNDLYILLLFKNGKKSRVKNGVMRKKAPQTLLNFYEAHLSV